MENGHIRTTTNMNLSNYLDPDEMIADISGYATVTGVTQAYPCFVPASHLLTCEGCNTSGIHPAEIAAVKPKNHTVMMCTNCLPEPPEEWL